MSFENSLAKDVFFDSIALIFSSVNGVLDNEMIASSSESLNVPGKGVRCLKTPQLNYENSTNS